MSVVYLLSTGHFLDVSLGYAGHTSTILYFYEVLKTVCISPQPIFNYVIYEKICTGHLIIVKIFKMTV